jgi:two-component system, response regulator YesN
MGYKLVIADDEHLIIKNLTQIIDWQRLDCEIVGTAQNGQEALEIVENNKVDLLLTDISMPRMTGIELLKKINSMVHKPIVILISGYDDFEYAKEGLKHNAWDYILKPIDYEELQSCAERAIEKLKKRKISEYEHEKYVIYELITTGEIDSQVINKKHTYFSMVVKTNTKNIESIIINNKGSFLNKNTKLFVYRMSDEAIIVVAELSNCLTGQVKMFGDHFAKHILNGVSENCVMAIGKAVDCLFDIKHSFNHARELMKYENFISGNIITEELLKEETKVKQSSVDLVDEALTYIRNHFQTDIGIEQVAEQVGLSVSYFSLLFKQRTGITFLDYLTNLRIEYACLFLENSDLKTYEIAQKVGYTDQRYFSQVFKKRMKRTPSEYRKMISSKQK